MKKRRPKFTHLLCLAAFCLTVSVPTAAKEAIPTLAYPHEHSLTPTEHMSGVRKNYERQKYGLFIHYVPELTVDAKGQKPSIDELVDRFDARQIAKDAADFGVEYVIFTAWHLRTCTLYPSAVNKKWRDDKRNPSMKDSKSTKTYSERDLIDQLSTELSQKILTSTCMFTL